MNRMRPLLLALMSVSLSALLLLVSTHRALAQQPVSSAAVPAAASLEADFSEPPVRWKSRPLWFWNGPLDRAVTRDIMERSVASGYYGFGILPTDKMGPAFMSAEFLDHYRHAVDTAARLGLKMCLYDEFWFPSGGAGGLLKQQYPEALSKRLDKVEVDIEGPDTATLDAPSGAVMAAVAMQVETRERVDLTKYVHDGHLSWPAPAGKWKVMLFVCVPDGGRDLVDYLDAASVKKFVELTYEKYYQAFPQHFGKTIDSAFYDEPTFHWVQGGRAWTPTFNQRFEQKYGAAAALDYPALWYDIGPGTAAARNRLFGLRAELFSQGFIKTVADWCQAHDIELTGHVDQEEIVNPVGLCGDLIKSFQYQPIPGLDQIFKYDRGSCMYKVISSAALNYDRRLVMTECYGAIDLPIPNLYREAMDQFAKGVNMMVPHAVWYRSDSITFPPELSYRTEPYASELPRYNQYIGRLQRVLQHGRPVVDIAVLYPIHGLQAAYYFGPGEPYTGGVIPSWADYMEVGQRLSQGVRQDFTYLHPETLDEHCRVGDSLLALDQVNCPQQYRLLILPGMEAISLANLRKARDFFLCGGKVIATTRLPDQSAEEGQSEEVRKLIRQLFGTEAAEARATRPTFPQVSASSVWQAGGHDVALAFDGNPETRWNAQDQQNTDQWLEVDFGAPRTFEQVTIKEAFGRATSHELQYWDGGQWSTCASGGQIGEDCSHQFAAVTADRVRLVIPKVASDTPSIAEFSVLDAKGDNLAHMPPQSARVFVQHNDVGGTAWFLEHPTSEILRKTVAQALPEPDVGWSDPPTVQGGHLTYLHKEIEGRHFWFFANSSDTAVDTEVQLRDVRSLSRWDPHTGKIAPQRTSATATGVALPLQLPPVSSVFLVGQ